MHGRRMNVKSTERQFHHSSAFENHQMWCLRQLKNSKNSFTFSFCSSSDLFCCERCSGTFHSNYNFSKRAVKARHGGALCNCAGKTGKMATKKINDFPFLMHEYLSLTLSWTLGSLWGSFCDLFLNVSLDGQQTSDSITASSKPSTNCPGRNVVILL